MPGRSTILNRYPLYSNVPCISYGVHDEHSVALINDQSIYEIYSYYEDLKHLDKMNQFEFDLSYMNHSHLIPKVNPKLITISNMDWKINEYFAFYFWMFNYSG